MLDVFLLCIAATIRLAGAQYAMSSVEVVNCDFWAKRGINHFVVDNSLAVAPPGQAKCLMLGPGKYVQLECREIFVPTPVSTASLTTCTDSACSVGCVKTEWNATIECNLFTGVRTSCKPAARPLESEDYKYVDMDTYLDSSAQVPLGTTWIRRDACVYMSIFYCKKDAGGLEELWEKRHALVDCKGGVTWDGFIANTTHTFRSRSVAGFNGSKPFWKLRKCAGCASLSLLWSAIVLSLVLVVAW